jgi:hypothetical protein
MFPFSIMKATRVVVIDCFFVAYKTCWQGFELIYFAVVEENLPFPFRCHLCLINKFEIFKCSLVLNLWSNLNRVRIVSGFIKNWPRPGKLHKVKFGGVKSFNFIENSMLHEAQKSINTSTLPLGNYKFQNLIRFQHCYIHLPRLSESVS